MKCLFHVFALLVRYLPENMMFFSRRLLIALLFAAVATTAMAQDHPGHGGGSPGRQEQNSQESARPTGPGVLSLLPADAVTEHSLDLPSGKLDYTATAGTFSLFDQSGERSAAIFYTAFVAKSAKFRAAAGHFRFQRRAGRGIGLPQSRPGGTAHRRIRRERPRWVERASDR